MSAATTLLPSVEELRAGRARLAQLRQELLAPVSAILSYQEMLADEAARLHRDDLQADLERIRTAARRLFELVDRLVEAGVAAAIAPAHDLPEIEAKLRHDLRTPLNAIIGYAELLREDMDVEEMGDLTQNLDGLLHESARLLESIERIVMVSRGAETGVDEAAQRLALDVVRSIRPVHDQPVLQGAGGRILIVDDHPSNREVLCRRLEREGHLAVAVSSGHEALMLLARESFDIVLLDLLMPEMNGYELLVHLKADPRTSGIRVIMASGLHETDSVTRCIEAGADDYLEKPVNPVLLRARVGACLERKRARDQEAMHLAEIERQRQWLEEKQERIDRDLRMARTLQATILPTDFTDFSATSIAVLMQPAYEMGGDFYDVFRIDDKRVALVIADVSDKGMAAAFFMAVTRTMIRSIAISGLTPAQCIAKVNDTLCSENPVDMFVTVFYAELDEMSGLLTFVNAGHCEPIVASSERGVRLLERSGDPALGIMPHLPFSERNASLAENETLFLYTDGVTEAMDHDKNLYGVPLLIETLRAHAGRSPEELMKYIIGSVEEFSGSAPQSDDITCLAICRHRIATTNLAQAVSPE